MDPKKGRIGPDGLAALLRRAGLSVTGVRADSGRITVVLSGPEGRPITLEAGPPGAQALFATETRGYRCLQTDLSTVEHAQAMLLVGILARLEGRLGAGPAIVARRETTRIAAADLTPEALRAAGAGGRKVEAMLTTADPDMDDDFFDHLDAMAAAATLAKTTLLWVVPATTTGLARPDRLVVLADRLHIRTRADRVLAIEWPDPAKTTDALPFSAVQQLPEAIVRALGDTLLVRSHAGRPLCLFPGALERLLLNKDIPNQLPDGVFGPQCDNCPLQPACGGVTPAYAARFGTDELHPFSLPPGASTRPMDPAAAPWDLKLWWLLLNRPAAAVALREVFSPDALPQLACVLPWTRLEIHEGGSHGPCCSDFLQAPGREPPDTALDALWLGPLMRAVRRAIAAGEPTRTCRPTCPVLVGGTDLPADLVLRGGPQAAVLATIKRVGDLLAGREVPTAPPAALCFAATSFCNYDCVMCDCGERGTLDDQPDPAFFDQARSWASRAVDLEVNGGEPLASPRFRDFLDRLADDRVSPPPVGLVTNGSLLTPERINRWAPIFRGIVVSLNAADPATYRAVNRGIQWEVVRGHLDHLLRARHEGLFLGGLAYSMVVMRSNLDQIPAFVELALSDDVDARFLLPQGNRNDQSVMTVPDLASRAAAMLQAAAARLEATGRARPAAAADALARVLLDRINHGVFEAL